MANTTEKKLLSQMRRAIEDFSMIRKGERILVGLSGGKDSWALLHLLHLLRSERGNDFGIGAVTVDPGYPDFDPSPVESWCRERGYAHFTEPSNMYEIIEEKRAPGTSYCAFCSRLRRGILYGVAEREGYDKIALGHHADDLIETLLLAQFFTGEIKSMPPVLWADDGRNVVIRPLVYCREDDLAELAMEKSFPVVSCGCVLASCVHTERQRVKALIGRLERENPGVKASILKSLGNVRFDRLMIVKN
ncbi:tRNA 2-thiocytidine(32) synthetase TtcA [bacterium]|nr:MAG: tRNA 2-thiocytidine(32) synthetase TtcA [bacterium]